MKKLLLTALLTTLFSGNLWAQVSDWRLTNEGVEIEVLEKTVKIKIMAQSHSAKLGDRRFDTVHLPGTFGKKSNIIELNLDKSKCYIPTNPDLINCRDSEANITVINGDGKVLLNAEFFSLTFETQKRITTWVGGDGNGNPDVRDEDYKVIRLSGVGKNREGILDVEVLVFLGYL